MIKMMDRLTEEVREESQWTVTFADDIVMCSESRESAAARPNTCM